MEITHGRAAVEGVSLKPPPTAGVGLLAPRTRTLVMFSRCKQGARRGGQIGIQKCEVPDGVSLIEVIPVSPTEHLIQDQLPNIRKSHEYLYVA